MIEQLASDTKIIELERLSKDELKKISQYTTKKSNPNICIIQDNRKFDFRDNIINELKKELNIIVLDKVFPDPKISDIMEMANDVKNADIDLIIGIGGGSTLDSAKGVRVVLDNGGDLEDYLGASATKTIEKKNTKMILIPTTAGTGAEVTKFGVYTARSGRKHTLNNPLIQADIAVLVSEFTYTLPPEITAATAFDALSHALESLWNNNASDISDELAIDSAAFILNTMEKAYDKAVSGDTTSRRDMLLGACKAGIAFNHTGTAIVHALSFIFGEEWHIPHGISCAFTLEDAIKLNIQDSNTKSKLVALGKKVFDNINDDDRIIEMLIDKVITLKKKFKLPMKLSDLDITITEDKIGELFNKSLDDPKMSNNIILVTEKIIFDIIKCKI